jgi:hypothetical protein
MDRLLSSQARVVGWTGDSVSHHRDTVPSGGESYRRSVNLCCAWDYLFLFMGTALRWSERIASLLADWMPARLTVLSAVVFDLENSEVIVICGRCFCPLSSLCDNRPLMMNRSDGFSGM